MFHRNKNDHGLNKLMPNNEQCGCDTSIPFSIIYNTFHRHTFTFHIKRHKSIFQVVSGVCIIAVLVGVSRQKCNNKDLPSALDQ